MNSVKEILIGYIDPVTLKWAVNPIGETGLNQRVRGIGISWQISRSLRRKRCFEFGVQHCTDVFVSFLAQTEFHWLSETLRIMDRAESKVGGTVHGNFWLLSFRH